MIDRKWLGHALPVSVLAIERTRLQDFAQAIGETNPVYTEASAARDAGYPDLPAPPTFLFSAELDSGATYRMLADLGVPVAKLLHCEQGFIYHRPACVGDTVTVHSTITDLYDKKNGALEFIVKASVATNQHGELLAELRSTLVCRHETASRAAAVASVAGADPGAAVGEPLPALHVAPVDRETLARFADASGDGNPIHQDVAFAQRAGMPDVIAHGMLGMAWVGRLLTGWAPQSRLRRFSVRFQGITQLGNAVQCSGHVVETLVHGGERCARVELHSADQFGGTKIVGEALVALP